MGTSISTVMPSELLVSEKFPAKSVARTEIKYDDPFASVNPLWVIEESVPVDTQLATSVPWMVVPIAYS